MQAQSQVVQTSNPQIFSSVSLRRGTIDDATAAGAICYEAFKNISEHHNFPPDFPNAEAGIGLLSLMLSRPDIYSVVAEMGARVVGSNFLWEDGQIAGIGPITVDPAVQNSSVGRSLMDDVLRRARQQEFAGVRLVQAAYHNRSLSLYTKLGFDTREPLSVFQGLPLNIAEPGRVVRPATIADAEECNKLCVRIHGHERRVGLAEAIREGTAMVVETNGRITGFTTSIGFLGYTVGESNDDLKALIGAANEFSGPGFLLPTRNSEMLRWCLNNGLRIVMPMTLMTTGLYNEPRGAFLPSVLY